MINDTIYRIALWLDSQSWSTQLHESYYMYNWIESTHVLSLMVGLGLLLIIDLRLMGLAFVDVPIQTLVNKVSPAMLWGFVVTIVTGLLLFYAIPIRTSQSVWFRLKVFFLVLAAINAVVVHYKLKRFSEDKQYVMPALKKGALFSLAFWIVIVISGRLIAYDWFDCAKKPEQVVFTFAGCIANQTAF